MISRLIPALPEGKIGKYNKKAAGKFQQVSQFVDQLHHKIL